MNPIKACTAVCALLASCANVTQDVDTCEMLDIQIGYSQETTFSVDKYEYNITLQYEDKSDVLDPYNVAKLYRAFLGHWKSREEPNYPEVLERLSSGYIYVVHEGIGKPSDVMKLVYGERSDVPIGITWMDTYCNIPEYGHVNYQTFVRREDIYYTIAHELLHHALYAAYGDSDRKHTNADYWKRPDKEGNFLGTLTSEVEGFPVLNQEPP